MLRTFTSIITLATLSVCNAEQKPTPIQPKSGYHVHDEARPHPAKVTNAKVVSTPAPSDATILFDGSDISAWDGDWEIKDGLLVASKGDLVTKEEFGKIQLHIEYRIPKDRKVKGQVGGNSGIFIMGRFEVQVQESHNNVTYPDGQAGALYGQDPPLVNASSPQGEWQSYDIIFEPAVYKNNKLITPAKVTVTHNGVLIHHARPFDGVSTFRKLPKYPKKPLPAKGPIKLQWHNDPVEFRNIWVRELGEYSKK